MGNGVRWEETAFFLVSILSVMDTVSFRSERMRERKIGLVTVTPSRVPNSFTAGIVTAVPIEAARLEDLERLFHLLRNVRTTIPGTFKIERNWDLHCGDWGENGLQADSTFRYEYEVDY